MTLLLGHVRVTVEPSLAVPHWVDGVPRVVLFAETVTDVVELSPPPSVAMPLGFELPPSAADPPAGFELPPPSTDPSVGFGLPPSAADAPHPPAAPRPEVHPIAPPATSAVPATSQDMVERSRWSINNDLSSEVDVHARPRKDPA